MSAAMIIPREIFRRQKWNSPQNSKKTAAFEKNRGGFIFGNRREIVIAIYNCFSDATDGSFFF